MFISKDVLIIFVNLPYSFLLSTAVTSKVDLVYVEMCPCIASLQNSFKASASIIYNKTIIEFTFRMISRFTHMIFSYQHYDVDVCSIN
jgi:hypothetical protein